MLNPSNNRLNYGTILYPPNKYELDFAIGTSYSLDLDALVGSSISLGLSQEIDSNLRENPIFLLEALRSTSDKIALFCENGRIHYPNKPTQLYILLEDIIFQVNAPKEDNYSSFHPKFWLLRFVGEDESVLYRFIILSRNLTFDRSWDISFTMEGIRTNEETDKNSALSKFIEYLIEYSTNDVKTGKIEEIIEELRYVHFNLDSKIFNDFEFIVNGIGDEYSIQNQPLLNDNWDNLFIMSPFLSKDIIKGFNDRNNQHSKATLITREMSLGRLKPEDCNNFDVYRLKDVLIDGEDIVSEDNHNILKQDIHAKMYLMERGNESEFYLGSLNASHNAVYNNVEFMVKLSAKKDKFSVKMLAEDIFNGQKDGVDCPFQIVDMTQVKPESKNDGKNLDLIIKKIVELDISGNIAFDGEYYSIELTADNYDENDFREFDIKISPLLISGFLVDFSKKITFEGLSKVQLSEFFVLTIFSDESNIRRVIKIPLNGMPKDRKNDVISSIIDDETAFIKYVAFLLGDDCVETSLECGEPGDSHHKVKSFTQLPALYEKMLKTACDAPEKFIELDFLIKTLSDDNVIPEGFEELYYTFLRGLD